MAEPGLAGSRQDVLLLAVDASPRARVVTDEAIRIASDRGMRIEVLHVRETDVVAGEDAAETEPPAAASEALAGRLEQVKAAGIPAHGTVAASMGSHASVAQAIIRRASETGAAAIIVGASAHGAFARLVAGSVVADLTAHAPCPVLVIRPGISLVRASAPVG